MLRGTIQCRSAKSRRPAFARVPEPIGRCLPTRALRLRELAADHQLARPTFARQSWSRRITAIQDGLPEPETPGTDALVRARDFGMPPLDRNRFTRDEAVRCHVRAPAFAACATIECRTAAEGRPRARLPRRPTPRAQPRWPATLLADSCRRRSARRACVRRGRACRCTSSRLAAPRCDASWLAPGWRGRHLPGLRRAAGLLDGGRLEGSERASLLRPARSAPRNGTSCA